MLYVCFVGNGLSLCSVFLAAAISSSNLLYGLFMITVVFLSLQCAVANFIWECLIKVKMCTIKARVENVHNTAKRSRWQTCLGTIFLIIYMYFWGIYVDLYCCFITAMCSIAYMFECRIIITTITCIESWMGRVVDSDNLKVWGLKDLVQ
jgi:hypothetical protein